MGFIIFIFIKKIKNIKSDANQAYTSYAQL